MHWRESPITVPNRRSTEPTVDVCGSFVCEWSVDEADLRWSFSCNGTSDKKNCLLVKRQQSYSALIMMKAMQFKKNRPHNHFLEVNTNSWKSVTDNTENWIHRDVDRRSEISRITEKPEHLRWSEINNPSISLWGTLLLPGDVRLARLCSTVHIHTIILFSSGRANASFERGTRRLLYWQSEIQATFDGQFNDLSEFILEWWLRRPRSSEMHGDQQDADGEDNSRLSSNSADESGIWCCGSQQNNNLYPFDFESLLCWVICL